MELNQPLWAVRYGFSQLPNVQNSATADDQILMFPHAGSDGPFFRAWGMATEFERCYAGDHPGTIRVLCWVNQADTIGYQEATPLLKANGPDADLSSARAYYEFVDNPAFNRDSDPVSVFGIRLHAQF